MKEFLKRELYSFRAVAAILARWLLLAVPTGLVCGAVGTAFHLAVEHVTEWRAEHIWLLWLLPVAGLAIVALYKITGCEGMGTNNVIRAVHSGESVSPLLVPAIFFGTVLTHLCGGSAGREGAALQMGGSIGYNIAKLFRFSDHDRRTATACGMAAFFVLVLEMEGKSAGGVLLGTVRHAAVGDPLRHHGGGRGPRVLGGLCPRLRRRPHRLWRLAGLRHLSYPFCADRTGAFH